MTIFETIGMCWVVLTSSLATVGIFYFAVVGLKHLIRMAEI